MRSQEVLGHEDSRSSGVPRHGGIDQHGIGRASQRPGPLQVFDHRPHVGRIAQAESADDPEAGEGEQILGRLMAVQLHDLEPELSASSATSAGRPVDEQPDDPGRAAHCRR